MNFELNSEKSNIIKSPLWDLMLSTNDCYPGCGCEEDFFDMTLNRVKDWVLKNDYSKALSQIEELLSNSKIDVGDLQIQTGIPFQNFDEVKEWLLKWKALILESLNIK